MPRLPPGDPAQTGNRIRTSKSRRGQAQRAPSRTCGGTLTAGREHPASPGPSSFRALSSPCGPLAAHGPRAPWLWPVPPGRAVTRAGLAPLSPAPQALSPAREEAWRRRVRGPAEGRAGGPGGADTGPGRQLRRGGRKPGARRPGSQPPAPPAHGGPRPPPRREGTRVPGPVLGPGPLPARPRPSPGSPGPCGRPPPGLSPSSLPLVRDGPGGGALSGR